MFSAELTFDLAELVLLVEVVGVRYGLLKPVDLVENGDGVFTFACLLLFRGDGVLIDDFKLSLYESNRWAAGDMLLNLSDREGDELGDEDKEGDAKFR